MEIKDGGPAFPVNKETYVGGENYFEQYSGMSLRDYFAANAPEMPNYFRNGRNITTNYHETEIKAVWAFEYADAMLKARGKA